MPDVSKIMDSEYEIMKVLWNENPLTANEIFLNLSGKKSWSKSTVNTLINRLVDKGALSSMKRGVYFYSPLISEAEYTAYHADNFLKKLFDGNAKKMLAYFCSHEDVTTETLNELKQMIEETGHAGKADEEEI